MMDSLMLKAPVFGMLLKKVAVAKFSRTLSTMMSSGVPILEGLSIVSKTSGNEVVENALLKTRQSITEGRSIAEPLAETGIFPPMVVQMISVGEATGALDSMLSKIADFYDDEVDAAVDAMTALLEPIMMVFLGGVVGGMIIAMYLPIFKLASVVGDIDICCEIVCIKMVGMARFERATPASRTQCPTKLGHIPTRQGRYKIYF